MLNIIRTRLYAIVKITTLTSVHLYTRDKTRSSPVERGHSFLQPDIQFYIIEPNQTEIKTFYLIRQKQKIEEYSEYDYNVNVWTENLKFYTNVLLHKHTERHQLTK